ncbi:trehalase family glycosidase [uncultured Bacteroides sp.]|uniref:trehalase family glycosidase n=1 Tax=uncultured Bacteroides sp. TaxID=162156 RepID=UPI002AAAF393|nr:trehalase family glycosidase [uncultured Bacteroides sp.]
MKYLIKKTFLSTFILGFVFALTNCDGSAQTSRLSIQTPEQMYGDLFYKVMQTDSLFGPDAVLSETKSFVDLTPRVAPALIRKAYEEQKKDSSFSLPSFLKDHFTWPVETETYTDTCGIDEHIMRLWSYLRRNPTTEKYGTLIPLKHPYIVPGGRFREIYYWDSYFTMLGLQVDRQTRMVENMIDNFSEIIRTIGFIPNGNRTYYISRSQPPFYSYMIDLLAEIKADSTVYMTYLPELETEYAFWTAGEKDLKGSDSVALHSVRMQGGEVMNRYCDSQQTPRTEMYREDVATAREAEEHLPNLNRKFFYQDLRSGAESGWDFSSRWLADGKHLYTIHTTDIIPVDLNCLLYHLEKTLAIAYRLEGEASKVSWISDRAQKRKIAINDYCWDAKSGFYRDFDWKKGHITSALSLAGVFPLYAGIANESQAASVAKVIQSKFLKSGGVVTTLNHTGQQWDFPNGWAPLQWVTVSALDHYGRSVLADTIANRWMQLCRRTFDETHRLMEKYDVVDYAATNYGEYPTQDGFGWTNGVYRKMQERSRGN